MKVAITGASGGLGQEAARRLLERLGADEVVLVTRDPAGLGELAERGVSIRHGDFDQQDSLRGAFAGVERVLVISTDNLGRRVPQHLGAIEAAKTAGVRHVVYTSILNPSEANPAVPVAENRGTEEALVASGLEWTMLRNGPYAENAAGALEQAIASGRFVHNYGAGACAFVCRDDCAAVAAAVLTSEGHQGQAYDVTGPELLSGDDLATLASAAGGVEVQALAVDDETFVAGLVEHAGLPEPVAQIFASFGRAIREGHFSARTNVVEDLTGHPARPLRSLLEHDGEEWARPVDASGDRQ